MLNQIECLGHSSIKIINENQYYGREVWICNTGDRTCCGCHF